VSRRPSAEAGLPIAPKGAHVVFLLDAASAYEAKLLDEWLETQLGSSPETVRIKSSRRRRAWKTDELDSLLDRGDDVFLIPTRVVWMAPEKHGRRSVGWSDVFKPGDARDPYGLRARVIRSFHPSRVRLIASTGASLETLRNAHDLSGEVDGLGPFITRRAWRTLDKAERELRGNRYKIPRFVPEAILSRGEFVEMLEEHARESHLDPGKVKQSAERYLREIAATHSPYVIDLIANGIHTLYRQGYAGIRYSQEEVGHIASLGSEHPIVFLPSHRSNLDRLSLQFMLWENDLPPNHTAGGINLDFFPIGPLLRRTGVFFIRRSFRDNQLYKLVLRAYIDYLVEKRFPLEWYLEGGRSRSGKLNPPRFGLLSYVVDAQRRGKCEDILLIPVSITYDQIQDVPGYAREAQGRGKERESVTWLVKAVRSLRRRYGNIYIRIAEPVSVAAVVSSIDESGETSLGLQKLAFQVMYRIGRVTPITPVAVVSIALLAARGKAATAEVLAERCRLLADFVRARGLTVTEPIENVDSSSVTRILDWLAEHGNVSSHEAVDRRVFWLDDDQMIRLSYYRNVIVHYFVNRSIAEIAIASLIDEEARDPERVKLRMLELRDLMKFEFFFPERDEFLDEVVDDIEVDAPAWESNLDSAGPIEVLAKLGEPVAHWALLPFLDSYQIVGDELESLGKPFDEKRFLQRCLDRARLYSIEERLISGESASQVLFKSALGLAHNRGLLDPGPEVAERRARFAEEIRETRALAARGLQ